MCSCWSLYWVCTTYGPIKSTFTRDHGSSSASLAGKCPYFFRCFLNNWQVRHVLQNVWTWLRKFGHVHVCQIVASVRDSPGCARYSWYQATTRCWSCTGMYIFPWYVMTSTPSSFVILKLSFVLLLHFCLSFFPVLDTLQLVSDLVENLSPLHLLLLRRYKPYYHS